MGVLAAGMYLRRALYGALQRGNVLRRAVTFSRRAVQSTDARAQLSCLPHES
ncbi:hypothetical protein BOMU111920_10480 [Bordetella muralis]